ncbi:MAG: hypothetical protein HY271_00115 [Deltaproteobacteria bacterium]|nr:hypothetical protein [Deltaproteobacteria bacterium]
MQLDLIGLQDQYSKLDTEDLLRLSESRDFTPEVQRLIDAELARRRDLEDVVAARAVHQLATLGISRGIDGAEISETLVKEGLSRDAAASIVRDAGDTVVFARRKAAESRMLRGVVMFAVGVSVTALTYQSAANTGGYYVVASGAIVVGSLEFLRGAKARLMDRRRSQDIDR